MNLIVIAGTSFLLGFSGAMMPGPLLTLTIAETMRRGVVAGPLLIFGHALLEGVLVVSLFLGLARWVEHPWVFLSIALLGGAMLVMMGFGMLRQIPRLRLQFAADDKPRLHPVAAGVLVSLANPYFSLWWATVGLTYLLVARDAGWYGVIAFYLAHISSDFVWYAFVSGMIGFGRRFISDTVYRGMIAVCAVFLIGFGGYFGYCGLLQLAG